MVLGSEGRMGILTEVKLRVTPIAEQERFYVAFMPNWSAGREVVHFHVDCLDLAERVFAVP